MYKIICLILVIVATAHSDDVEDLISEVFGPQSGQQSTQSPSPTENAPSPVTTIKTNSPCVLNDGSIGKCIPYYLCDNKNVRTEEAIDPIVSYESSECESYVDLCC